MADFVAELRPRSCQSQGNTCSFARNDFIAELKPKRSNPADLKHSNSHSYPHDDPSDLHLQKVLSERKFSKESITSLLEGSIVTLVETVLTGRSISKIKGSLCISMLSDESPIVVNLYKAYPKENSTSCLADQTLDTTLNIKIKDRDISTMNSACEKTVSSCSPSNEFNRELCHSPAEAQRSPQSSSGYHSGKDSCFSSPEYDIRSNSSSPCPNTEDNEQIQVRDSDNSDDKQCHGEKKDDDQKNKSDIPYSSKEMPSSGVSMKEKTLETFNEYFCSGFDGKSTLHIPVASSESDTCQLDPDSCGSSGEGSDEMDEFDDDDEESEHRLVIDDTENPKIDEICNVESAGNNQFCKSESKDWSVGNGFSNVNSLSSPVLEEEAMDNLSNDTDVIKLPVSSDIIDADSHMYLPGNSKGVADNVSLIPHPQSIVSKHPKGFKCKECYSILPNTLAVSKHVQHKHDLHCCTYCCRTFTAKNNLKRHVRRHTGQKPYKCPQCSQSFFRGDELKGHMIRHDYSKPFRCSLCKKGYTDRACVKNHMAKEHKSRLLHVCPQCGESFDDGEAFTTHKSSHPELQQFSCSKCTFIGTNSLMTLKHSLLHRHKLFSCKPCNAHFADPFHYTNHFRKHKKNPLFTKYICCFCDVELASYDQYVRHEYSHAQGKLHTCKTCKKQFKSKTLLRDHAMTHQERSPDNSETEQSNLETMDADKYKSPQCQSNDIHKNNLFKAGVSLKSNEFARQFYNSGSQENLPSRLLDEENDEFSGQLLDLSMKKSSGPACDKDDSKDVQNNNGNCRAPLRTTVLSVNNASRNVSVTSEPVNLSRECAVYQRGFDSSNPALKDESHDNLDRTSYKSRNNKCISDTAFSRSELSFGMIKRSSQIAPKTQNKLSSKLDIFNRAKYVEKTSIVSEAQSERKGWLRGVMNNTSGRLPLRFSPYCKEKMVDLAAKFMVARGSKLAGQREPLKVNVPVSEENKAVIIKEQNKSQKNQLPLGITLDMQPVSKERIALLACRRRDLASQALMDNGDVTRECSNPETALRCHIPTVVKSEPMMEQDESADTPLDYRFQKTRGEDSNSDISTMNGISHDCEICRTQFDSFIELENHSVDVHKRYLCEHCKKSFTARPNRDRHVRYHTGERPYRCDLCDMAFFRGDDLKYHRTTRHPSAQPYVCTRCSASFTWGRDLERHIRHSRCKV